MKSTPTQRPEQQHLRSDLFNWHWPWPPESSPSSDLGRILVIFWLMLRRLRKRTSGNVDPAWIGPETLYLSTLQLSQSSSCSIELV
jgi:hypothetical protein